MSSVYDFLTGQIHTEFATEKELRRSPRGSVVMLRHRASGKPYVFRTFKGNAEVYRKLLQIRCPYLPRVYEAAEQNGQAAVLEEYIQGDNLQDLLACANFPEAQAKSVIEDLCKALWVLHGLGAVHRDIKPQNIILRGKDAVLIDFDASRVMKKDSETDTRVLGTAGFAAPEQFGMNQTDGRADIYSLGVLLNVMLTGSHPSKKLVPGRLGRVIRKCTMIDPDSRYRSVLHLLEDL
jgi:serine/threonine protein kinase